MDEHHLDALRKILRDDGGVSRRLHSPRKAAMHLRRRGFQTALGNHSPKPPLTWTSIPARNSPVFGQAWIGLDGETLQKTLALGFLPPKMKRPAAEQVWGYAMGRCRSAMLEGERYVFLQEAAETPGHLVFKDPFHPTLTIPKSQLCETDDHRSLRLRCRATGMKWLTLLDHQGNPIANPNHSG